MHNGNSTDTALHLVERILRAHRGEATEAVDNAVCAGVVWWVAPGHHRPHRTVAEHQQRVAGSTGLPARKNPQFPKKVCESARLVAPNK